MIAQQTMSTRAWAELILLALIWGASFLAFAIALKEVSVFALVAHRVTWAAIGLWIIALLQGWTLPSRKFWLPCLIMGILNNVIPFSLIAWGQLNVESGLASIYNASTAIFGILIAAMVFSDERLTRRKIVGVSVGFFGVVWAIGWDSLSNFDIRALSQLAIIAASISYGLASCWGRAMLKGLDSKASALGMLTGSSIVIIALTLFVDGLPSFQLSAPTWGAIIYISVLATAVAYMLYYRVLALAGAANLMLVTLLIPPIAIALGAVVLNETISSNALTGFLIIGLGMVILDGRLIASLPFPKRATHGNGDAFTTEDKANDDLPEQK